MTKLDELNLGAGATEIIRERLRNSFAEMIPQEKWEELIQSEIDFFFEKERVWGQREYFSPFGQIVQKHLSEFGSQKVKEFFDKEVFADDYTNYGEKVLNESFKKFILENSGELFATFIGSMLANGLAGVRSNMNQNGIY